LFLVRPSSWKVRPLLARQLFLTRLDNCEVWTALVREIFEVIWDNWQVWNLASAAAADGNGDLDGRTTPPAAPSPPSTPLSTTSPAPIMTGKCEATCWVVYGWAEEVQERSYTQRNFDKRTSVAQQHISRNLDILWLFAGNMLLLRVFSTLRILLPHLCFYFVWHSFQFIQSLKNTSLITSSFPQSFFSNYFRLFALFLMPSTLSSCSGLLYKSLSCNDNFNAFRLMFVS
jgi:hypothetical protein